MDAGARRRHSWCGYGHRARRRSPRRSRRPARADRGRGRACASPPAPARRVRASRRSPTRGRSSRWSICTCPDDDGLSLCLRTRGAARAAAGDHLLRVRRRRSGGARRDRRRRGRAAEGHARRARCSTRCATARPRRWTPARCARSASGSIPDDLPILGMLAHGVGAREVAIDARARAGLARGAPLGDARAPRRRRAARIRSPPPSRACDNTAHAHERSDPRGAEGCHRPRAPPLDRRARDGPLHRHLRAGGRERHGLADDPRLPDQRPFPDRRLQGGQAPSKASRAVNVGFDVLSDAGEGRPAEDARPPRRAARGRARAGRERRLHRLRQGRRRQVHADRQPRRGAAGRGQDGRRARRRRLGLLDPAHARASAASARRSRPRRRSSRWRRTA